MQVGQGDTVDVTGKGDGIIRKFVGRNVYRSLVII